MDSITEVLTQHYPKYKSLPKESRNKMFSLTLLYMYKEISASAYTKKLRSIVNDKKYRFIEMRRTFVSSGYFVKNIKVWLYYWYCEKPTNIKKNLKLFGIKEQDKTLHTKLEADVLKLFNTFHAKKSYKHKTIREFDAAITRTLETEKCRLFIRKMVYRKMRFIFESNGMEPDDIIKHVTASGIQAAMFTYPRIESGTHLLNIITRTAHNDCMNYLDKYTTKKRARLNENQNYSLHDSRVVVPIDSPEAKNFMESQEDDTLDKETLRESVRKLIFTFSEKQQLFIKLLSGQYDETFTKWLTVTNKSKKDNDELFDSINFLRYTSLAMEYLDVTEKQCNKVLNTLKEKLFADYQSV